MYDTLIEFTDYLNLGFYYKAHEFLEDNLWIRKDKSERNLYVKGLINAAVAMELVKKGKIEQGKGVWQTYLKYKIPSFYEINFKVENNWEKLMKGRI